MRRIPLLISLAVTALVTAACPPTYPNCSNDDHCKEHNEVCVQGKCAECSTNEHCKEGFACEGTRCVPKAECGKDADCAAGKKCRSGRCVFLECETDKECAAGSKCRDNKCVAGGCTSDDDCPSGQECRGGACVAKPEETVRCNWDPIPFAFNEYSLSSEAQNRLAEVAECIKKENARVRLEGHADERGTEEYNLQLSNKRAASVKKYLVTLGVTSERLDTLGYGETRPSQSGASEDAWAANRRVELKR